MGEDFIRRTEKSYRRALQRALQEGLISPNLLTPPLEEVAIRYPCFLLEHSPAPPVGVRVVIHMVDEKSRIPVLDANVPIGFIDGEAARHVAVIFRSYPNLCNMLEAEVVSESPQARCVELAIVSNHSSEGKAE